MEKSISSSEDSLKHFPKSDCFRIELQSTFLMRCVEVWLIYLPKIDHGLLAKKPHKLIVHIYIAANFGDKIIVPCQFDLACFLLSSFTSPNLNPRFSFVRYLPPLPTPSHQLLPHRPNPPNTPLLTSKNNSLPLNRPRPSFRPSPPQPP